jgi:hypothetical protein
MIKTVYRSPRKVLVLLSDFNECWIFSADFLKKNFTKRVMGAESFPDMMQVMVAFHNFTNTPKYWINSDEIC